MATINEYITPLKTLMPNPLIAALATGGLIYGTSRLAYPLVAEAAQFAGKKLGMSDNDLAELPYELNSDKNRSRVPAVLAAMATAGILASNYDRTSQVPYGGIFSRWDDPRRTLMKEASFGTLSMLHDQTSLDFGKMLPIRMTKDIIMNDPNTSIYHKGNALSIINNAAGQSNTGSMTSGQLFDSTLNKVQQNLTLGGVTNAAVRGVIGYGMAKAFTGAMGSLVDMPKSIRDGIVSAGMITNIIQGLD